MTSVFFTPTAGERPIIKEVYPYSFHVCTPYRCNLKEQDIFLTVFNDSDFIILITFIVTANTIAQIAA
jgi:hypothetical protein